MSLSPAALRTFTFAAGASIANFYYVQPLLVDVGQSFGLPEAALGLVPTLSQIGLGFGVLFLLPLGDVIDNRRLVSIAIAVQSIALLVMAAATNLILFYAACVLMGFTGITSYLLAPYVAHLVPAAQRGRIIGLIARGAVIGILLARTVSGLIGFYINWRAVYFLAAIAMMLLLWLLRRYMVPLPRPTVASYGHLLLSLGKLARDEPVVRRVVFTQALNFSSFNCFWLGLSLYLESPAFGLHSDAVGLFGFLGALAAVVSPIIGRVADQRGPAVTLRYSLGLVVVAWVILLMLTNIYGIITGIILLDVGCSAADVSNRTILFRLHPDIRTRLMALYGIGMFFSAGIVSLLTTILWAHSGWTGICLLGLSLICLAFLLSLRPPAQHETSPEA